MVVSKIPDNYDATVLQSLVNSGLTLQQIADRIGVTKGTLSKHLKKVGVTNPRSYKTNVSKNIETDKNIETTNHVGSAGKNQGADHHPSSHSSTPNPPVLPSPKPEKLTEDYLEQYLIELSLIDKSPGTARLILDFLYKKQGLSPAPDGSDDEIDLSLLYKTQEDEYELECKTTKPETTDTNC